MGDRHPDVQIGDVLGMSGDRETRQRAPHVRDRMRHVVRVVSGHDLSGSAEWDVERAGPAPLIRGVLDEKRDRRPARDTLIDREREVRRVAGRALAHRQVGEGRQITRDGDPRRRRREPAGHACRRIAPVVAGPDRHHDILARIDRRVPPEPRAGVLYCLARVLERRLALLRRVRDRQAPIDNRSDLALRRIARHESPGPHHVQTAVRAQRSLRPERAGEGGGSGRNGDRRFIVEDRVREVLSAPPP